MATRATKSPGVPAPPSADAIARALTEIYGGPAWHGPSVRVALRGVRAAEAAWRPAPGRNSIDDLVLHLAYTRHLVLGRLASLQGRRIRRFPRPMRSRWYPRAAVRLDDATWREDLQLLDSYQEEVLAVLHEVDRSTLGLRRRGKARTIGAELMGIAFHDAYHAGQIRVLSLTAPAASQYECVPSTTS